MSCAWSPRFTSCFAASTLILFELACTDAPRTYPAATQDASTVAVAPLGTAASQGSSTRMLRHPDVFGDRIVFTYGGDLWQASTQGGTAARLTSHPGLELFAKYSPDGAHIAFTGQYGGDEQVYVIPTAGGAPKQLTFYPAQGPLPARWGYDNQVYGWSPHGKSILFRSLRDSFDLASSRLFTVPLEGGLPTALPMPVAGAGDFSPDGRRVVYSPLFRDFRTWKRYQGGWAQDLYLFDLAALSAERITDHVRADRDPMWIGDAVFFNSDRDGKFNLYRYDLASKSTAQVTRSTDWDVRWPSADGVRTIVFEREGRLALFDVQTAETRTLDIFVPSDGVTRRAMRISAAEHIESFALGPDGKRILFAARGDILTVPAEKGLVRNLTHSSYAHDREADWSPDGKRVVFVSDATGEEQLYLADEKGSAPPEQLTRTPRVRLYAPRWSPDGKRIAYTDKDGKIYVVQVGSGRIVEVADEPFEYTTDYVWSPDGRFLALAVRDPSGVSVLHIWDGQVGRLHRVSDGVFQAHSPAWGPKGDYVFYLSEREFQPQLGIFEFNYAANRATQIYALALRKDAPSPFPPKNDEAGGDEEKKKDDGSDDEEDHGKPDKRKEKPKAVRIDFEGLADRVTRVPVDGDNYEELVATRTHLLYLRRDAYYYGRESAAKPVLVGFSFEDDKATDLLPDVEAWSVAADGKKVLAQTKKGFLLVTLGDKEEPKEVSTDDLWVDRVPAQEWSNIFGEVWRRFRDHFYVANMHGYDWTAIRKQYEPLVAEVADRAELNNLMGEMIAELNVSHAYVADGDMGLPDRPTVALPGARFDLDRRSGRYRIAKIFAGQNAEERYRSPLTEVGVDVKVGDFLIAINGQDVVAPTNPYELLQLPTERPVELTVNGRPDARGARRVLYRPLASETDLLYLASVAQSRERVAKASGGRIGYLHVPDMGDDGIREFIKWYYPQVRKEGLIIDVRGNGGGNVSQMLIERLRRTLLGTDFGRNVDVTMTYPDVVFHGPMVTLINETSASDGDIFPYMFRKAGLGPLIGKRTWGGVIGITDHGPVIDGGSVYVPEFGSAGAHGEWIIEGHGVDPDIEVDNDPMAVIAGRDPQLERGVQEVLRRLVEAPSKLPTRPAPPDKTR